MKLQQLRYICEVAKHNLNLSNAAESLFTSQPGISKQVRSLEDELGVDIFVRHGKRVVAVTEPGKVILEIAQRVLKDVENLKQVSEEFTDEDKGHLIIATTHTQARYALPHVIQRFTRRYPGVRLSLRQGSPTQISELVTSGEADIAIATEAIEQYADLVMLPCYEWNRCVLVPPGHPLLKLKKLTLEAMAAFPIITYDFAFTGRSRINQAFTDKGLAPNVVLTAIDADVIKTYVELGMGIGIVAMMAYDPRRDTHLKAMDASHLFEPSTTRIGIRKNSYLRGYTYDFIEMFAPHLDRGVVDGAMKTKG
ncbi:MAG TPA: HTH-type transcriptional regulator CysB [Burkholderiales bacterium]|jgi:LysR family cys regulon transcriptional activator|nr:HTH-type transcriptional regulator CysB [Burkholderiales bacterium]